MFKPSYAWSSTCLHATCYLFCAFSEWYNSWRNYENNPAAMILGSIYLLENTRAIPYKIQWDTSSQVLATLSGVCARNRGKASGYRKKLGARIASHMLCYKALQFTTRVSHQSYSSMHFGRGSSFCAKHQLFADKGLDHILLLEVWTDAIEAALTSKKNSPPLEDSKSDFWNFFNSRQPFSGK